jgi:uncharacterized protein (DUF1800 family)
VFGRFEDMLRATAQHPAMLFYLDNWTSVAPDAAGRARRPGQNGRERGINENYARELLELHTLGVDGGYTQEDVVDVARALTGWSFQPPARNRPAAPAPRPSRPSRGQARPGAIAAADDLPFVFRPMLHDAGEKVVLGHTLAAGRGIEDGLDVLHIVATHPSTARFIATKMIERFVTDAPTDAMVDDLAGVFTRTGGDLREVARALFSADWFHESANVGTKIKTPFELVASALRVTHADVQPSRRLIETLRSFGQLPYAEAAPTGFRSRSEDWVNAGAMLSRMNFGLALAAGQVQGVRLDGARLMGPAPATADGKALERLLERLMPGIDTEKLEATIRADPGTRAAGDSGASAGRNAQAGAGGRVLGLALGSPEFQRR